MSPMHFAGKLGNKGQRGNDIIVMYGCLDDCGLPYYVDISEAIYNNIPSLSLQDRYAHLLEYTLSFQRTQLFTTSHPILLNYGFDFYITAIPVSPIESCLTAIFEALAEMLRSWATCPPLLICLAQFKERTRLSTSRVHNTY